MPILFHPPGTALKEECDRLYAAAYGAAYDRAAAAHSALAAHSTIDCHLIQCADGTRIWVPAAEYGRNPEVGSFVVKESRPRNAL